MSEEPTVWAKRVCELKDYVMHLPTKRVGQITKFNESEEYVSPINDAPVTDVTVELTSGDVFVANPDHFVILTKNETKFFEAVIEVHRAVLGEIAALGISMQVEPQTAAYLVATSLRMQATALVGPPTDEMATEEGEPG